jgi:thiamine biosynthesis protein ThiI
MTSKPYSVWGSKKKSPELVDALVAHYHEVGLKKRNRDFFEAALVRNLKRALKGTGYRRVRRRAGRIIVDFMPEHSFEEAISRATRVFGVANVGAGLLVEPRLEGILEAAQQLMSPPDYESFSVRARRAHSRFPTPSGELNIMAGRSIQQSTGARVDLSNPDTTLYIEIFGSSCVVYRDRRPGPGGLPTGVSGRLLCLLSGGIDSPVAAWRMMRRGSELELVHFHGSPYTDSSSMVQAADLARALARYQPLVLLHLLPLADAQREVVIATPSHLRVVLYRRMMLRLASALAAERGAAALVTGDSLGQVASQTIENLRAADAAVPHRQVLRPLIGMDKLEIMATAGSIGTLSISTRRHQDCCVLFEPPNVSTRASATDASAAEADLDIEALVGKALAGRETRVFELQGP